MRAPSTFMRLIGLGFAALIGAGAVVAITAAFAVHELRQTQERLVDEYTEALLDVEQLRSLLTRRADASAAYLLTGAAGFLDERAALTTRIEGEKRELAGAPNAAGGKAQLRRVLETDSALNRAFNQAIAEGETGSPEALRRWQVEVAPVRRRLDRALDRLVTTYESAFRSAAFRSHALATRLLWTTIAVSLVALLLATALALAVARALARLRRSEREATGALEREEHVQRLLAESGAALAAPLSAGPAIDALARVATRDFADVCVVDLLEEETSTFRRLSVDARRPEDRDLARLLLDFAPASDDPSPATHAVRTCQSEHIPELTERMLEERFGPVQRRRVVQALGARSLIAAPILSCGRAVGALTFIRTRPDPPYGARDVALAEELARRAAVALDNARLYQTTRRAVEARDRVLAIVSHDLKNPLGAVLMSAQQLRRAGADPARSARCAERIEVAGHRMERLIQDLLDLTSLDAGGLSIRAAPLAPGAVVAQVIEQLRPLAQERGVDLHARVAADLPLVRADAGRIEQVLSNLVGNAIKFSPPEGSVDVELVQEGDLVRFSVSDEGPGIPAEQRAHVFERFWQAKPGAKLGSGLGLSIAKGLVEAHGGRIWVEPRAQGSTFAFTLPAAAHPGGPAPTLSVNS